MIVGLSKDTMDLLQASLALEERVPAGRKEGRKEGRGLGSAP